MPATEQEIRRTLKAIREMIDDLERKLSQESSALDVYGRRRELLQRIYWSGNSLSQQDLMPLLESRGTDYRWIAQQVKVRYLSISPTPGGGRRYSVTQKGIRELGLDKEEQDAAAFAMLSDSSFAEDWDSPEDAAYDQL